MNFLLRELKAKGVMQKDCIACASADQAATLASAAKTLPRAVFFMGSKVRPGPYWAVHEEDADSLTAAGFHRIDTGETDRAE